MSTTGDLRSTFALEALSSFERAIDDVLTELLADGVLSSRDVGGANEIGSEADEVRVVGPECDSRFGSCSRGHCVTNARPSAERWSSRGEMQQRC